MRNLYKRLNIPKTASTDQINQAIIRCQDRSVKADAETVLLNPKSKALYDHTHNTLSQITRMRNGLGLCHGENWNTKLQLEFDEGSPIPLRIKALHIKETTAQQSPQTDTATVKEGKESVPWVMLILIVGLGAVIFLSDSGTKGSTSTSSNEISSPSAEDQNQTRPEEKPNVPPAQLPAHGAILRYHSSRAVAPLEIKTSPGSYYFVKMVDFNEQPVVEIFIHGGRTIEIEMPLGSYSMKYGSGNTWYGRGVYFGKQAAYSKSESIFSFKEDYNGYSGYTVTLYKVASGNMQTKGISQSDF